MKTGWGTGSYRVFLCFLFSCLVGGSDGGWDAAGWVNPPYRSELLQARALTGRIVIPSLSRDLENGPAGGHVEWGRDVSTSLDMTGQENPRQGRRGLQTAV